MEETASNMRSEVGNEFRAAYDYWKTQKSSSSPPNPNGRPNLPLLVLGDRPIPITRSRCWETLRENGDITNIANELMTAASNDEEKEDLEKELQSVFFQNNDDDDDDTIAIEWLNKYEIPGIENILIYKRNFYMACKLRQSLAFLLVPEKEQQQSQLFRAVAIVSAAHVQGFMEIWNKLLHINDISIFSKELLVPLLKTKRYSTIYFEDNLLVIAEIVNCAVE